MKYIGYLALLAFLLMVTVTIATAVGVYAPPVLERLGIHLRGVKSSVPYPDLYQALSDEKQENAVYKDAFSRIPANAVPTVLIQIREYVYVEYYTGDANVSIYHVLVYHWNGKAWVFVEDYCGHGCSK